MESPEYTQNDFKFDNRKIKFGDGINVGRCQSNLTTIKRHDIGIIE